MYLNGQETDDIFPQIIVLHTPLPTLIRLISIGNMMIARHLIGIDNWSSLSSNNQSFRTRTRQSM